jgi:hypothetical protein
MFVSFEVIARLDRLVLMLIFIMQSFMRGFSKLEGTSYEVGLSSTGSQLYNI